MITARLFSTFLFQLLLLLADAQHISVESFRLLENDLDARVNHPIRDQNGELCAIIKVATTQSGFEWEPDGLGIVSAERKTGEYWLYVPRGAQRITIKHDQLGILRNYRYPVAITSASVYEMVLTTAQVEVVVREREIKSQWIAISSDPEGTSVFINDQLAGTTPFSRQYPEGEYTYRLELPRYHPEAGRINLSGDREMLHFEMRPRFGNISISSSPESGMMIFLNDENTGKVTPATLYGVSSGNHTIRLINQWYQPSARAVTISDNQNTIIDFEMIPAYADITILTIPPADIFVDNRRVGHGTHSNRMLAGLYDISSTLGRHSPARQQLTVEAGRDQEITLELRPRTGQLSVTSTPFNARIMLDGKDHGTTPATIRDLLIGEYTLSLSIDGYGTVTEKVTIAEGQTIEINTTLPEGMEVIITSTPSGADLYINDIPYGKTPFVGDLAYGSYLVNAIHDDVATTEVIEVRHGEKSSFEMIIKLEVIDADGNIYETVKIGNQFWMVENLKTTTYNDGRRIAYLASKTSWLRTRTGAYTWYRDDIGYKDKHGAFYNWYAVNTGKLCPAGWGVPTDEDWKILEGTVDTRYSVGDPIWNGSDVNSARGYDAGQKLRSATLGFSPNSTAFINHQGTFMFPVSGSSQWWSTTEYSSTHAWYRELRHQSNKIDRLYTNKNYGFPVRCVRR